MWHYFKSNWFLVFLLLSVFIVISSELVDSLSKKEKKEQLSVLADSTWIAPSLYVDQLTEGEERALIIYGEELIGHTSLYFGPKGKVAAITNGMNCQNCHLDAGKRPWGNNYGAVYATYPKYRDRSGRIETINKRVNDCFERSLNGKALDSNSKEMKAIYAYIKWLGKDVVKDSKPVGSGLEKLPFLDRAANPENGKVLYLSKCSSCHGAYGEGQFDLDSISFTTPPLWGPRSYNDGAGLYRLSNFASFIKNNMPFNLASHNNAQLTNEEAWDIAAFVNSQPRPHRNQGLDWPDLSKKPVDFPFGPYADTFSEQQHKYGPFKPIVTAKK